ncbi:hypothetical protein QZM76_07320, partial [Burkholderia multivorans]|nr:hypothetical protein [Burkholderia multivorans]
MNANRHCESAVARALNAMKIRAQMKKRCWIPSNSALGSGHFVPRLSPRSPPANSIRGASELKRSLKKLKAAGNLAFTPAESIIKCNTPDLPCTRPCRRPMGTRYQHLSAEERATIMIMLQ